MVLNSNILKCPEKDTPEVSGVSGVSTLGFYLTNRGRDLELELVELAHLYLGA